MKYKNLIDPELRSIARKIPYNKFIIKCANIFQTVSFRFTKIPAGIINRKISAEGYRGLKFKTEIFEPSNEKGKMPCLIYVHGGAFSYRASAYHKKLACIYAAKAKCRVYFPDYHLTPEYPYPAAYADVVALYRYIMRNADRIHEEVFRHAIVEFQEQQADVALLLREPERGRKVWRFPHAWKPARKYSGHLY